MRQNEIIITPSAKNDYQLKISLSQLVGVQAYA